jgi:hypothetical protein
MHPGGCSYLDSQAELSIPEICQGEGVAALQLPKLHQLLLQLCQLAQPLAEMAVQLRTLILPALPWLFASSTSASAASQQQQQQQALCRMLPANCESLAMKAAAASAELVQVCSVLPAVQAFLQKAVKKTVKPYSAGSGTGLLQATAPRAADPAAPAQTSAQTPALAQLDAQDQQLLRELSHALVNATNQHSQAATGSSVKGPKPTAFSPKISKRIVREPGALQQQESAALVQRVRQRWQLLLFKNQALQEQYGVVASCTAEQARLVGQLVTLVTEALSEAAGTAGGQSAAFAGTDAP